jgi:transmembrane sensor
MSTEHDTMDVESRLRAPLEEAAVSRLWGQIRDARAARAKHRKRQWAIGAGALAVAAAVALGVVIGARGGREETPQAGALRVEGADVVIGEALPGGALALDDGSQVTVAPRAELEVLANDGERFVTLLRRGRCHFAVQPGGPRRWSIETDLATVEVVGTEFSVERGEAGLVVSVDHGVVLVRGERVPGRVRRLRAGERLEVEAPAVEQPAEAPVVSTVELPPPELAAPTVEPAPAPRPPRDLDARMADADAARAAGRPDEAARILQRAVREGGSDPRAALAAFSLGRLQLEVLDRPDAAAESFARVVAGGSPRALVEDAQARRVEALVRAGRRAEAAREARVYESRWPEGRRLAQVRALIAE